MTESRFQSLLNAVEQFHYIFRASRVGVCPANLPIPARWLRDVAFAATNGISPLMLLFINHIKE
jgi:hypothetical protein